MSILYQGVISIVIKAVQYYLVGSYKTNEDEKRSIKSRDGLDILCHVYKSGIVPSPVLINLHGSGFILPLHGSDDEFAALIARKTDYTVIDVRYRLAPAHPFPAGIQDAEDVVRWVQSRPDLYDQDRISISGFSAGANFVLALRFSFEHVILFYPPTDLSRSPYTKRAPDTSGRSIPPAVAKIFDDCYLPAGVDRAQPKVSPINMDAKDYPRSLLMITCDRDGLCLEAEALKDKMKAAGTKVVHSRMEQCDHAWDKSTKKGSKQEAEKYRAYEMVVNLLTHK